MSLWEKALKKSAAFGKAFLGLLFFVCADYAVTFAFIFARVDRKIYKGAYNFATCVAVFITMMIIIKVSSMGGKPLIRISKLTPDQIAALVIIGLGMIGLVVTYIGVADKIAAYLESMKNAMEDYRESVDRYSDTPQVVVPVWDAVLYVITLCFIVPVTEEMTFRGVIFGQLRKGFGPWVSVILSALFFGIMHGISVHIGYAIACGLIIAACYHITDSLIAPVILHMVFNFFGSGVANFMSIESFGIPRETTSALMSGINISAILFMPIAVLAYTYLVAVKRKRAKEAAELAQKDDPQVELSVEENSASDEVVDAVSEDDGIEAQE